jgi:hypothetical protein
MNFEQLLKTIKENYHRLKDETFALNFVRYHYELLQWKRNKLKLGAIVFEIKETYFNGVLLHEEVDIRHIRQDNTKTDELKLENRLKAIAWKWDFKNVVALMFVIFGLSCELYTHLYYWYQKNLPSLAYRSEHYDYILKYGLENSLISGEIGCFKKMSSFNYWLVNTLTDFCTYFNIIF